MKYVLHLYNCLHVHVGLDQVFLALYIYINIIVLIILFSVFANNNNR